MAKSTFWLNTKIHYGWGALEALDGIKSKRAMIVSDPQVRALGFADKVQAALKRVGAETVVFDRVEPDPSRETVDAALEMAHEFQPDTIVGLGGGSAMDTAKGVRVRYETPGISWDELNENFASHPTRKENLLQHIAIPSTSGTGSEATVDAVITHRGLTPAVKHAFFVGHPHISIVDAEIASTMPPGVTANTGMDVMAHAIEGYLSVEAQPMIDAIALHAMRITMDWLPRAVENGKDREARERMHIAATMGGIANNAGAITVHSMAHQLGSVFGIPHGRACAIMLPYGIAFAAPEAASRCAEIAWSLGIIAGSDLDATEQLIGALVEMNRRVGIPASIREAGVDEARFAKELPAITSNALADGCFSYNPRKPALADFERMYRDAWAGAQPKIVI